MASLAKWLSVCLRTKWFWVRVQLQSLDVDTLKEDQKEFIKNNKLILKTKQRHKSERHNLFTEEFNKTDSGSSKDKRIQSIDVV